MADNSDVSRESDWVIRDAVLEDEPCLVSMWLKSYARSREVARGPFPSARVQASEDHAAFWRLHQPIVMALLAHGRVRVACLPGREGYADGRDAVIVGWACTSPGLVHWVGLKYSIADLERGAVARDLARELLEGLDEEPAAMTFDLVDLRNANALPATWQRDHSLVEALRGVSYFSRARDDFFASLVGRVMATPEWMPKTQRAA